ncbi:EamA domain [Dillenia turbinata]|uniref:WAT1-related protein n=1 Tax=Dillenia turbinata TaxID=194707 RepID=A0AAN8VJ61_9MAGN
MMGRYCYLVVLPFAAMLALECIYVGSNTLFKAASNKGLSNYVFVVYSHGLSSLLLVFTTFFGRRRGLQLNISVLLKMFLLGIIGAIYQILLFKGVSYSSPALASAATNLVPAFTFILAIIFRMEQVKLRSSRSWAKIIGTIVSISGALVVTLYEGPVIVLTKFLSTYSYSPLRTTESRWVTGGLLLTAAYMLVPLTLILQAQILKEYPSELVLVFFNNLFLTLVSGVIGLVLEPNLNAWRLSPDVALAAILYTGTVGKVLSSAGYAWVIHLKGPLYVAMFTPMNIAIAVAMGFVFLGETLHVGSLVGAIMICIGFYAVLWGKANDEKGENCKGSLEAPSSLKTPLLEGSHVHRKKDTINAWNCS